VVVAGGGGGASRPPRWQTKKKKKKKSPGLCEISLSILEQLLDQVRRIRNTGEVLPE
jgi:hypothetical protein